MFFRKKKTIISIIIITLIIIPVIIIYSSTKTKYGRMDFLIAGILKFVNLIDLDLQKTKHKDLRDALNNLYEIIPLPLDEVKSIENLKIPTKEGFISLRVYTPHHNQEKLPVLIYYHGGGWVLWNLNTYDGLCRSFAKLTPALVFSVGYNLSPEYPFPTALNESYQALEWISNNAPTFGGDPNKIALAGDSAGANLATVVSILARDRQGPKICAQALFYPVTDLSNTETRSYNNFAEKHLLTKEMMKWFRSAYLPNPKDWSNPLASPLLTKNLKNLPPAFIITNQFDPLRDEGEAYAQRLKQSGNQVTLKRYQDTIHAFMSIEILSQTNKAKKEAANFLKKYYNSKNF